MLRFTIASIEFQRIINFPINTLISNSIACLLLGLFVGFFLTKDIQSINLKLFFITGICGGFSTFSAFTFETMELIKADKYILAGGNIFLNFILCVVMIIIGVAITRLMS